MKMNNFKHTMLTVGVITALGMTGTAANAAGSTAGTGPTITNTATATYKIGTVTQPEVTSNTVTVTINELGSFSLIASQGISDSDNKNEEQKIAPGGSVNFKNILENTGNVDDTYTIDLKDTKANVISATDDFNYANLSSTEIFITVTRTDNSSGTPVTVPVANDPDGIAYPTSITPGQTIKLAPHDKVQLSYDVTPDGDPDAGKSGLMQISATSEYLTTKNPTTSKVVNEDQGIITKPIFAIVKKATNTPVDLNATNPTIQYEIKVTNQNKDYSADATNIGIEDIIPTNLDLDTTTITVKKAGTAVTGVETSASTKRQLKVSKINLAKGESVTITFTAKITNKTALATAKTVENNAAVYDKFGTNDEDPFTDPNIIDSTDSSTDSNTNGVDDTKDDQNDSPSVVSFTNRGVDLEDDNTIELAQTGSVVVKHTITNTGNDTEGDNAGELIITVKDTDTTDTIKPTGNIKVEIYAKDKVPGTDAPLATDTVSVDTDGTTDIDIHDISAAGIPSGGKAVITYTEESANNKKAKGEPKDVQGITEISVVLKDPTSSNPSATIDNDTDTDTFNIGTLELIKEQVVDVNCTTDVTAATSFTQNSINAEPGQCVIYRITAKNKFNETSLTDVTISDNKSNWESAATYVTNSAEVIGVSAPATAPITQPSASNPAVSTTISTIAKKAQASLLFKVKLKTNVSP